VPFDPYIPLLIITKGIKVSKQYRYQHTHVVAVLFTITNFGTSLRWQSMDGRIKKGWYMYPMEFYLNIKKMKCPFHENLWK
jgi:hypothetical protein